MPSSVRFHGFDGIGNNIHEDLLELVFGTDDFRQVGIKLLFNFDAVDFQEIGVEQKRFFDQVD